MRYIEDHLFQESRRFSEIVDPNCKDQWKYGYKDFYAKDPNNKIVLPLINIAFFEARLMDEVLGEVLKVLRVKANEYLSRVNPVFKNSYENVSGNFFAHFLDFLLTF